MDRYKMHQEINDNMKQVDDVVILPMETWNKLSRYVFDLEKDKGTADALRGYIKHLEEGQRPKDFIKVQYKGGKVTLDMEDWQKVCNMRTERHTMPGIHIENIYVTVNHSDEQIYDELDQVGPVEEE